MVTKSRNQEESERETVLPERQIERIADRVVSRIAQALSLYVETRQVITNDFGKHSRKRTLAERVQEDLKEGLKEFDLKYGVPAPGRVQ